MARAAHSLALAGLLAVSPSALAAESKSATPTPAKIAVPPVAAGPGLTSLPPAVLQLAMKPNVSDLLPRRLHVLRLLTVRGTNFGKNAGDHPLRMRMGGNGFGANLEVESWTPTEVTVRIPKAASPGRYYVGLTDDRSQWVSNIDQSFEVLSNVRTVDASLDVFFRCAFDVLARPGSVQLVFAPAEGRAAAVNAPLAFAGQRGGTFGAIILTYRGRATLPLGGWRVIADAASRFDVTVYDDPTYWVSQPCAERRRVGPHGEPLLSHKQSRSLTVDDGTAAVTDDSGALAFHSALLIDLGSMEPPTPVCPPEGCK